MSHKTIIAILLVAAVTTVAGRAVAQGQREYFKPIPPKVARTWHGDTLLITPLGGEAHGKPVIREIYRRDTLSYEVLQGDSRIRSTWVFKGDSVLRVGSQKPVPPAVARVMLTTRRLRIERARSLMSRRPPPPE